MDDNDGTNRVVTPAVVTALERLKAVRLEAEKPTFTDASMGLRRPLRPAAVSLPLENNGRESFSDSLQPIGRKNFWAPARLAFQN